MENIIEVATDRVLKTRSDLVLARRFYAVLVTNVEPVLSHKVPTAATNGKKHFWNPNFVMSLSTDELLFVQCHESEHDARHHGTRRGGRDSVKWNEACDYAINIDLVDEKIGKPPAKALIDPKYRGMSAEAIYRSRELDKTNLSLRSLRTTSPKMMTLKVLKTIMSLRTTSLMTRKILKVLRTASLKTRLMVLKVLRTQVLAAMGKARRGRKGKAGRAVSLHRRGIPVAVARFSTQPKTLATLPSRIRSGNGLSDWRPIWHGKSVSSLAMFHVKRNEPTILPRIGGRFCERGLIRVHCVVRPGTVLIGGSSAVASTFLAASGMASTKQRS
jgi:hypothetical protein